MAACRYTCTGSPISHTEREQALHGAFEFSYQMKVPHLRPASENIDTFKPSHFYRVINRPS